jgi:hypothetical protein
MEAQKITKLEELVGKLDGVISAKVIAEGEALTEIHVLAGRSRNPKQLSRDIQSAVSAAADCKVDHNIISIAQIDDGIEVIKNSRLKISGLDVSYAKNQFTARVILESRAGTFTGTASGIVGGGKKTAETASACIQAVNSYLGYEAFRMYDIQKVKMGEYASLIAAVSFCSDEHDEKILTGTSVVKDDEYLSAVKAALNAINRVLPRLTPR